ncbi:Cytochrome P450 CYP11/CYP12/CYP24/CYP27 subfamily [Trichoderma simmonsii]|uniref:Cytochrome P450 CYP11/CYP12/CYP24/CYP27 subfamily n=1 Tax=Trichoderma simmonsii TaxID=1491479 RepID=A0A8G0LP68_9HYPO|nr:Cytochrome P450 CYP11/CYP12/CYP24/CYP27 subfamily [Trichoderma simmonsii]
MNNAAKNVKAFEDIRSLHKKYGDIVRVGPRELSINRPSAISVIYEPPTRTTRSPWYAQVSNDVTKISLNSTRVLKVHKLRKKVWERGLSFRGMNGVFLALHKGKSCGIVLTVKSLGCLCTANTS